MLRRPLRVELLVGLVAGLLAASPAIAEVATQQATLAVDEVIERDVGFARGVACDDPTVVEAVMRAKHAQTNTLVLRGLRVGATWCRAGTDPNLPSILFEIRVTPRRK